jgi:hypothetical protein
LTARGRSIEGIDLFENLSVFRSSSSYGGQARSGGVTLQRIASRSIRVLFSAQIEAR